VPAARALDPEAVPGVEADRRLVRRPGGETDLVGAGRLGPVDHCFQQGPADAAAPVALDHEHAEVDDPARHRSVDGADDLVAGVGHEQRRPVAGHGPVEGGPAGRPVDRRLGAHPATLGGHGLEGVHVGVEVAGHGRPERERRDRGRDSGHTPW